MKAFVITLEGHEYSGACAARCIRSAAEHGLEVERFTAIGPDQGQAVMSQHGLKWTWAHGNTRPAVCPITGLRQHPYGSLAAKIGCSMSHYLLWRKCAEEGELLVLEHDAVFEGPLPEVSHDGICQVNDPAGATPYGEPWSRFMRERGPGVYRKTRVMPDPLRPDGLAGNSAYLLKPWAAIELVHAFRRIGVWPNDATMCWQLFPYLQELYPFVTRVEQSLSTTSQ